MINRQIFAVILMLPIILAARVEAVELEDTAVLQIEEPWIRAVPPVVMNTAAYMALKNTGDTEVVITAVGSAVAEHTEMHSMSMANDRMTMRKEEEIRIEPGQTFKLEPHGWHIMLIGLKESLKSGTEVEIHLTFSDGRTQTVTAPVKRMDMMWEEKGSDHGSPKGSHHESHKGSH